MNSSHASNADHLARELTRREILGRCGIGFGSLALSAMQDGLGLHLPHHRPRAKNIIFLFMGGGPSQIDLFDHKPKLTELDGQVVPASFFNDARFAFLNTSQAKLLASPRRFAPMGPSGLNCSELLPHIGSIGDRICVLRGMKTEVINHGPAKLFMNTGARVSGRPSIGSWVLYGLGSENRNLPGFVVMLSGARGPNGGGVHWDSGFLSARYQGVPFRSGPDPILDLNNPPGIDRARQEDFFETLNKLNTLKLKEHYSDSLRARIESYELASRMQLSAIDLTDLSGESDSTLAMYGVKPGESSFGMNCLIARRLVERGVRFIQLYHTDWDHHGRPQLNLGKPLGDICREVDRPSAALVRDLEQRGLLEDTVVVWGGEFGRTPMRQEQIAEGRDHHIDAFTMWLAGGGIRPGLEFGKTDEIGYSVVENEVHVHDLHATLLHLLGIDHERFTYRFQGRDFRLTDIAGRVVSEIIA